MASSLAGESLFLTTYTCQGNQGLVTFTPEAPGSVIPVELAAGDLDSAREILDQGLEEARLVKSRFEEAQAVLEDRVEGRLPPYEPPAPDEPASASQS